ncbi:hypothetical protein B296_00017024 [Ensete ventricosum]|uniref:Uncharacterized protein n=1 Tax=Ensete ventricosum TaxID=4639 RepID=A0A427B3U6_ENSVE|nr:hypothetical protein B296_00017024 [Ensete ventricosum]
MLGRIDSCCITIPKRQLSRINSRYIVIPELMLGRIDSCCIAIPERQLGRIDSCYIRQLGRIDSCYIVIPELPLSRINHRTIRNPQVCTQNYGRTTNLTQVRSAPPTCKRTPHCKDDKHGGGYDGMESAADPNWSTPSSPELHHSNSRPPKPSSESLDIRAGSHFVPRRPRAS